MPDRSRQFGMQRLDAVALQPRAHVVAHLGGIGGTADSPRVSALKYRPEPPTKIGRRFCARASASTVRSIGHPCPGREIHRGVDMAVEPVRHSRFFRRRRPRRDHAEIAIDLHGIGIDDHAVVRSRQAQAPAPTCRWRSALRSGVRRVLSPDLIQLAEINQPHCAMPCFVYNLGFILFVNSICRIAYLLPHRGAP